MVIMLNDVLEGRVDDDLAIGLLSDHKIAIKCYLKVFVTLIS